MEFNRSRLLNNINILLAIKKLKKNEVETNSGVSAGYLSRLAKPDNDTMPSVDFVWRIARELGVTMDALIDYDFTHLNEGKLLITNFIQELVRKTDAYELDWHKVDNDDTLSYRIMDGDYVCPMLTASRAGSIDYYSKFFKYTDIRVAGPCYDVELSTGDHVYLMDVEGDFDDGLEQFWEIYILEDKSSDLPFDDSRDLIPICTTKGTGQFLAPVLDDLANSIEAHENEMKVSREAKEAINRFMNLETGMSSN